MEEVGFFRNLTNNSGIICKKTQYLEEYLYELKMSFGINLCCSIAPGKSILDCIYFFNIFKQI